MSKPVLIGDVVAADCAELRDIAGWFESRGQQMQGEFLRKVADRHEIVFGAYWTATTKEGTQAKVDAAVASRSA